MITHALGKQWDPQLVRLFGYLESDQPARQLAQAHGSAELSLLPGAGARLRHDPRAVAILLGWLDRMRSLDTHPSAELV